MFTQAYSCRQNQYNLLTPGGLRDILTGAKISSSLSAKRSFVHFQLGLAALPASYTELEHTDSRPVVQ